MKTCLLLLLAMALLLPVLPAQAQGAYLGQMQVINCDEWVSLRGHPDTSADRLAKVPLGAYVEGYAYNSEFVECCYNGQWGYILAAYLAQGAASTAGAYLGTQTVINCNRSVTLRESPSTSASAVARVPKGAAVDCYAYDGTFTYCIYNGMHGYILSRYLGAPPETGALTLLPDVDEFLSLRTAPSTSAGVLEKVLPGMRMQVLGVSGIFYLVRVEASGNVGYVHSGYVTMEGVQDSRWPYSYTQMLADIGALMGHPNGKLTCETLATSLDGRDIPVLRFGDAQASHHILIQAGIHGREYITSRLAIDLLSGLLEACPDGISDVMFHIIPMANPDGAAISLQGPGALNDPALAEGVRQILAQEGASHTQWKANARGTDLNRNFPEGWESLTGLGPGSSRYRGASPLSEPETQALAGYLGQYGFKATISYHSYGNIIYWEGAYTPGLAALNRSLATLFAEKTGYPLGANEAEAVERGGFKDWALGTCAIPSVTIEIGAVDCFGSPEEYAAIRLSHEGSWQQLAAWVTRNT